MIAGAVVSGVLYLQADRARRELAARNQALVLARARAELEVDPTTAVRTLASLPAGFPGVRDLARIAVDRGVARVVLTGHESEVRGAVFSPDGSSVASVGYDHTVRVWDLRAGNARVLRGHTDRVNFAIYAPSGALVSGGEDGVRRWGPGDGDERLLDRTKAEDGAFSPDGKILAVTAGARIALWEGERARASLDGPEKDLTLVAWSPGGQTIAAGCADGSVWVWPAAGGPGRKLGVHRSEVTELAYSDEANVLAAGRDGEVRRYGLGDGSAEAIEIGRDLRAVTCAAGTCVWADHDGRLTIWEHGALRHFRGPDGVVRSVAFAPDGQSVATGGDDRTVRLWDLATGAAIVYRGHRSRVRMVAFSPDGALLASAANDGAVRLWNAAAPERHLAHDGQALALAFAPDRPLLASGGADGLVRVVALDGRGAARTLAGPTESSQSVALGAGGRLAAAGRGRGVWWWNGLDAAPQVLPAPERVVHVELAGDRLAAATMGGAIPVWDLAAGSETLLEGHAQRVNDLRFLADGRLVSASDDRTVRVWDLAARTGTVLGTFDDHVTALALAPDGRIAATSADGAIRILPSGARLAGHEGRVLALAFSPSGRLASGGHDRTVRVWDLAAGTGTVVTRHEAPVTSLVWAGETLVSAAEDQVATAWDGREHRVLGDARRLAASPDGRLVAGAGDDGSVRLWTLDEGRLDLPALSVTIESR